ncbi:MAG: HAMP domain-containing histidine kinase [Leptolyngbya sp. SIO4C1]|nr:HAMP domain-containing histidine kinase [Leptolyngbya sp. SIO4C1]
MFQGLRQRLLLYQLCVMAAILGLFGLGVYAFFSRSLYRQLDQKLMTLAQAATPSLQSVRTEGEDYLEDLDEVPWRDIFNRNQQSLEWFDIKGNRLAIRGEIDLSLPPQVGAQMTAAHPPVRAFTVSVFERSPNSVGTPVLRGFIRASQTTQELQAAQRQLLLGLVLGGSMGLGLVGIGGLWLTQISLQPVERSYQQLKQFTADASHELRGPITAITTSVEVMQKHPERIHPKDVKKLQAVASAAHQLRSLAEDLLLLARMDAVGLMRSQPLEIPVALNRCLQDVIDLYAETARAKGLSLCLQAQATVAVAGDPAQYARLFSNLVQNALHYTQSGTITVSLSQGQRYARVRVADTGIGIAAADLPHVFDRFWQADKARTRRAGGSGLGLAIARAITQQYRGKIWVTSQPQAGSCFHVLLPLAKADEQPKAAAQSNDQQALQVSKS